MRLATKQLVRSSQENQESSEPLPQNKMRPPPGLFPVQKIPVPEMPGLRPVEKSLQIPSPVPQSLQEPIQGKIPLPRPQIFPLFSDRLEVIPEDINVENSKSSNLSNNFSPAPNIPYLIEPMIPSLSLKNPLPNYPSMIGGIQQNLLNNSFSQNPQPNNLLFNRPQNDLFSPPPNNLLFNSPQNDLFSPPPNNLLFNSPQNDLFSPPPNNSLYGGFQNNSSGNLLPPNAPNSQPMFGGFRNNPLGAGNAFENLDSNVLEITFEDIKKKQVISTGDGTLCKQCGAFLSLFSEMHPNWTCEFCGQRNEVDLDIEEVPNCSKILYVLESASQLQARSKYFSLEKTVIFCIDISGSMCCTQPVQGKLNLKTSKLEALKQEIFGIVGAEWMAVDNSDFTYVSRLECVQAAIETQLNNLHLNSSESKVGIITFNSEINVIGDGRNQVLITGDHLHNFERLVSLFESRYPDFFANTIEKSKDMLCEKLFELHENGSTALGPGLLISIILASQGGSGSKVILCTDGVANTGLGDLEFSEDLSFYHKVSELAREKGVEVSVISISDEDCRLDALDLVVEKTGGEISKIDPQNLSQDFANILANEVFATNSVIKVRIPSSLKFVNHDPKAINEFGVLEKVFGNVNNESLFTVEFHVVDQKAKEAVIQVAIEYKNLEGSRFVLVHTDKIEISDDKKKVIKDADFSVFAKNVQIKSGEMIKQGNLFEANKNMDRWSKVLSSNINSEPQAASFNKMIQRIAPVQSAISESISGKKNSTGIPSQRNIYPPGVNKPNFPQINPPPLCPNLNKESANFDNFVPPPILPNPSSSRPQQHSLFDCFSPPIKNQNMNPPQMKFPENYSKPPAFVRNQSPVLNLPPNNPIPPPFVSHMSANMGNSQSLFEFGDEKSSMMPQPSKFPLNSVFPMSNVKLPKPQSNANNLFGASPQKFSGPPLPSSSNLGNPIRFSNNNNNAGLFPPPLSNPEQLELQQLPHMNQFDPRQPPNFFPPPGPISYGPVPLNSLPMKVQSERVSDALVTMANNLSKEKK